VLRAAADEVSAFTATLFNSYVREYQAVIKQAAAFHDEFARLLAAAAYAYAETETAASRELSAPTQALLAPLTGGAAGVAAAAEAALVDPVPTPVGISLSCSDATSNSLSS
jgi:PE family